MQIYTGVDLHTFGKEMEQMLIEKESKARNFEIAGILLENADDTSSNQEDSIQITGGAKSQTEVN